MRLRDTSSGDTILNWHINDHLGTPQALTDRRGRVVWAADYMPFGNIVRPRHGDEDRGDHGKGQHWKVTNNFRFPGQYYDAETGLNYNMNRDYDPALGRYIESDPIGLQGGMNTFGYVSGDPVNYIDIKGLIKWKGYVTSEAVIDGGGAMRFRFDLTSECRNGKVAHMVVIAGGFALGVGIRVAGTVTTVEFDDHYNDFNPDGRDVEGSDQAKRLIDKG